MLRNEVTREEANVKNNINGIIVERHRLVDTHSEWAMRDDPER